MSNPNKRKGTAHESAVVSYLVDNSVPAYRVAQTGRFDSGDIHGAFPFVLQAKNWANITAALRDGVTGAKSQAAVAGRPYGVAVVKRPGKNVSQSYVVMDLETFTRLLRDHFTD